MQPPIRSPVRSFVRSPARRAVRRAGLLAGLAIAVALAPAVAGTNSLGRIDFPNSGAPEAQDDFLRGVLLLHSFEYDDAREAFQEAQQIDPDFALAHWGEAMTHNHPLWRRQDEEAALAALADYAPSAEERRAKAPTEREALYLGAVDRLYGEGDKLERDLAYSEAMGDLAERYPDDLEARAFYALSILGTAQAERDFRIYMRAAAVAEEIFAANPLHPGAGHYLIHSYDDPVHAPLGLRAARVYDDIAPAASHAQHMISHIFVALGHWADSVDSNVRAYEVSKQRREAKGLPVDQLNYHALHWLEYSYLQLGRREAARDILELMRGYAEESGTDRALWHYAVMRAMWNVETLNVETLGADRPAAMGHDVLELGGAAQDLFADALVAVRADELDRARAFLDALADRRAAAAEGGTRQSLLDTAEVLELALRGAIAARRGDEERAVDLMQRATAIETAMPLDYGPPDIVKPSHELYGEILLAMERPEEAVAQFETALYRAPRRTLSLVGLATAAAAAGREETRAEACEALREIVDASMASLPAACGGAPAPGAP